MLRILVAITERGWSKSGIDSDWSFGVGIRMISRMCVFSTCTWIIGQSSSDSAMEYSLYETGLTNPASSVTAANLAASMGISINTFCDFSPSFFVPKCPMLHAWWGMKLRSLWNQPRLRFSFQVCRVHVLAVTPVCFDSFSTEPSETLDKIMYVSIPNPGKIEAQTNSLIKIIPELSHTAVPTIVSEFSHNFQNIFNSRLQAEEDCHTLTLHVWKPPVF